MIMLLTTQTFKVLGILMLSSLLLPLSAQESDLNKKITQAEKELKELRGKLEDLKLDWIKSELESYGLPTVYKGEKLLWYDGFATVYNKRHHQPKWVAHMILPEIDGLCVDRGDDIFREDTLVDASLKLAMYVQEKKVYDRGHMAPFADLQWSPKASKASFFLTNITPQKSTLNQYMWKELEVMLRHYVKFYDNGPIVIVSGPVLKGKLEELEPRDENLPERISIPNQFYKVVLDYNRKRGIAFLFDQDAPKLKSQTSIVEELKKQVRTIDEIEELTGINFFTGLNNTIEREVEKQNRPDLWFVTRPIKEFGLQAPVVPVGDSLLYSADSAKALVNKFKPNEKKAIKVRGRVISGTRKDDKITLNLDQPYPNNSCYVMIREEHMNNFTVAPEKELRGLIVEFTGEVEKHGWGKNTRACLQVKEEADIKIIGN